MTKILLVDIDDTLYKHTTHPLFMDYNNISEDISLTNALNNIKYPKYIYTNAMFKHANTILNKMNLDNTFLKIYSRDTIPSMKPLINSAVAVEKDIRKNSGNGQISFFDDMLPNLLTAKKLGWTTIWIHPNYKQKNNYNFVDYAYLDFKQALLDNKF
jgi:FMN phosphatase YigB (HAD superfamily)